MKSSSLAKILILTVFEFKTNNTDIIDTGNINKNTEMTPYLILIKL